MPSIAPTGNLRLPWSGQFAASQSLTAKRKEADHMLEKSDQPFLDPVSRFKQPLNKGFGNQIMLVEQMTKEPFIQPSAPFAIALRNPCPISSHTAID